jgi:phosphoglycolate phosphatase
MKATRRRCSFVPLVVGFDLDMTLLDTRPGIAAAFRELTARTGVPIDAELAITRLGPPLRQEIAHWFPPASVDEAVELYRSLYPDHAITPSLPLPGAASAIAAVRRKGGNVVVITSKLGRLAELHLAHARLDVDAVYGNVFAEEKATVLTSVRATAMVGDHVADMRGGLAAKVHPIGVVTGPCSREDLFTAGAEVVLDDLREFPAVLDELLGGTTG